MASFRFACVAVVLAAILIPADNLNATLCGYCHETNVKNVPSNVVELAEARRIAGEVELYGSVVRYKLHSYLEVASVGISIFGLLLVGFGLCCGMSELVIVNVRDEKSLSERWSKRANKLLKKFHFFVLRGLGILVIAELVASVSAGINPTWQRLAVLVAIVGARYLLHLVWEGQESEMPDQRS